jgi:DNA-binding LacI/PurR family transcriptional regulator
MSDIAVLAGVSKVTVSAVLSTRADAKTRVAPATRQRVLDAAKELNYSPNGIAKMFRHRCTDIVGLYLGDWLLNTHDLFLAEIVSGLQTGCHNHRKDLLIHSTFRGLDINDVYMELISRKIDGLIMFAQEGDPLALRLASSSLPVVAIADAVPTLPSVVADDHAGSRMLADYLASKGHKHIMYRRGWVQQSSVNRRYEAFLQRAAELGMKVTMDGLERTQLDFSVSEREKAIIHLPPTERPTAIASTNDRMAYAMVDYLKDSGFKIPDDFAIVGFDGMETQIRPKVRLTTIVAPWSEVANTALSLVVKSLAGESIPLETIMPVHLAIGDTA